ncbi:Acetyltransferase (GNAT) domain-containing protein [Microlunatus flavus]|uniref:Acetyltransferase (GNAT) domain-containing protein n=1 Tax=Microlunatus flavus TaxID=1036181 RepID=A0A1H9MRT9_9ACTN|nr:Acetyltransferase (GNAT) domain-containing protein [Microlunatus flavus]
MVDFRPARVDEGDGKTLFWAMAAEIARLYDGLDHNGPDMPKAGPAELGPPHGGFWVGYVDGEPACCGGIKRLPDEGACEIKRMFVVPALRGRGLAHRLLAFLEDQARERGYRVARLDTGHHQPDARHIYETSGYVEIANFNANPHATYFAEKVLLPAGPA